MRVLVYKRTHNGDPDESGCFGIRDCMGTVRDRDYEAVIGVGGIGPEPQAKGIAGKVNWIGIGPHKAYVGKRGPEVTFDHFLYYGTTGPDFRELAPELAERMYAHNVRSILHGMSEKEQAEAEQILERAKGKPPSLGRRAASRLKRFSRKCKPTSSTAVAIRSTCKRPTTCG